MPGEAGVALVTGGARRIGRAVAEHLHGLGFDIAVHYRSSADSAQELEAALNGARPNSCRLFRADLGDHAEVTSLGSEILQAYGSLALLVNNASGFEPTPIATCTPEQFDDMLAANLRGPYFLVQALLPAMGEGSSIVNIVDVHIERPLKHFNAYGAAKAGLASLTRSLAVELAPGVRVNGVAPGAILWPEGDEAYDEETRVRTVKRTPLQRLGDPTDIARVVAFLACEAPFITGQVITVDGGRGLVQG